MRFSLILGNNLIRNFASAAGQGAKSAAPKADPLKNVVGLSKACVTSNEQRQVPGTGKEYKVPEYFGYNKNSYAHAEVEMENFRVPQPVAPRKL